MKTIVRRIDLKKVEEIKQVIDECRNTGFSNSETIFFEYKRVSKATQHEHAAANNPLYLTYNQKIKKWKIDADILKSYTRIIKEYNKNTSIPDEKIIGVPYVYQDLEGNECQIFYRELAHDQNIIKAKQIEAVDARIKGDMQRKEELIVIKNDKSIKKRQDNKMRVLQRRINKGRKE